MTDAERGQAALGLLEELLFRTGSDPTFKDHFDDDYALQCYFCDGRSYSGISDLEHDEDCIWVRAKQLVEGE